MNPGACAWVLGGICGDRIVLWHYATTKWNGKTAASMYTGPIQQALKRHRPDKAVWRIVEDNDPAGYKAKAAQQAKSEVGISVMDWPGYSPDLNPLDFSLWAEVEKRARAKVGETQVSATEYKRVLRQAALRLPREVVKKGRREHEGPYQRLLPGQRG